MDTGLLVTYILLAHHMGLELLDRGKMLQIGHYTFTLNFLTQHNRS